MVLDFYASVSGNVLNLATGTEGIKQNETQAPIGERLLDFVYYNPIDLNEHLDRIFMLCANMDPLDPDAILVSITETNPYLRYFGELLIEALLAGKCFDEAGFAVLCEKYPQEVALLRESPPYKNINHDTITKGFLIGVFSFHAMGVQGFIKSQLEFCMNSANDKTLAALTPMQRLYVYEQWREKNGELPIYFEEELFPTRMVMDKPISFPANASLEEWTAYVKKENPAITEMTELPNMYALMRYEMMHMVMQNVPIKKCANCGRYFINTGRSDKEYCPRPLKGQPDKTCESVGALLKHQNKVKNSDIIRAYNTAYKRANSSKRIGNLTEQEFKVWSAEAREKRDLCLAGKLSKEDFQEWLNKDRIYKPRG